MRSVSQHAGALHLPVGRRVMKINFDKLFDVLINKFHIVLGSIAQAAIFVYHFKTGRDIGAGVQNTVYGFYAFLAGHALTYQKYPDAPAPPVSDGDKG